MEDQKRVSKSVIRLTKDDITMLDIEAFVFYARPDLALGSGFGGAVAVRGGPSIQEELKKFGPAPVTECVLTKAGSLKAQCIIHAVGPRFQEEDTERKLKATVLNALKLADESGVKRIAFPPMGAGFYGVPLPVSARIMFDAIEGHLSGATGISEVVICLNDNRELAAFQQHLASRAAA